MKLRAILLASAAALGFSGAVQAQDSGWHAGLGYAYLSSDAVNLTSVLVRGGTDFTEVFGVDLGWEAEVGFGIGEENIGGVDVMLDNHWGVFARGSVPLGNTGASVFGRVGFVHTEIDGQNGGGPAIGGDEGVGAGAGAEWIFYGQNGVRVEYTRLETGDNPYDVGVISYVRRF